LLPLYILMTYLYTPYPQVINHKNYTSREEFDGAIHQTLTAAGVEIVCLAGFMRILSGWQYGEIFKSVCWSYFRDATHQLLQEFKPTTKISFIYMGASFHA